MYSPPRNWANSSWFITPPSESKYSTPSAAACNTTQSSPGSDEGSVLHTLNLTYSAKSGKLSMENTPPNLSDRTWSERHNCSICSVFILVWVIEQYVASGINLYHVLILCVHDDVDGVCECHVEFQIYAHTSAFRHLKYLIVIRCQVKSVQCVSLVVLCLGNVQVPSVFTFPASPNMEWKHLRYKLFVKSVSREGIVSDWSSMCTAILDRLKCSKLNGFSLYTPLYAVLRTHPTTIFFGSCPDMIPSLKVGKDPAGIVNTLQSTRFIGKYMLFFLWTLANARHTSGLILHFFTYNIALEISVLYPALVEMRLNCSGALTNLTLTVTPGGSSLVCLNTSSCM